MRNLDNLYEDEGDDDDDDNDDEVEDEDIKMFDNELRKSKQIKSDPWFFSRRRRRRSLVNCGSPAKKRN